MRISDSVSPWESGFIYPFSILYCYVVYTLSFSFARFYSLPVCVSPDNHSVTLCWKFRAVNFWKYKSFSLFSFGRWSYIFESKLPNSSHWIQLRRFSEFSKGFCTLSRRRNFSCRFFSYFVRQIYVSFEGEKFSSRKAKVVGFVILVSRWFIRALLNVIPEKYSDKKQVSTYLIIYTCTYILIQNARTSPKSLIFTHIVLGRLLNFNLKAFCTQHYIKLQRK